jgi:MarR family transcriptional regulator, multiple antibiotic resistance protein MarR
MTTRTPLKLDPDKYRFDDTLGYLVGKLRGFMMQAIEADLADLGITAAQGVMLMRIGHGEGSTAAALCRRSGYDTGSMTRMLDKLEDKGFMLRERSTEDRRVIKLSLSESGQSLCAHITKRTCAMLEPRLEGFSMEEYELLKSLLRRVLENSIRLAPNDQAEDAAEGAAE